VSRPLGLVPHLFVRDVDRALSFYAKAFGAVELFRTVLPGGTVLFVEAAIGDARLLLSQEIEQLDALAPATIGGTPMLLTLETTDPDDLARRAVFAGARIEAPVTEMFFGERYGRVVDPDGHRWALTTKREQFTPEDIDARKPHDVEFRKRLRNRWTTMAGWSRCAVWSTGWGRRCSTRFRCPKTPPPSATS